MPGHTVVAQIPVTLLDLAAVLLLLVGVGLFVLISRGSRLKFFRRIFGPSRAIATTEGKLFLLLSGVMCLAAVNTRINLMYLVAGLMISALSASMLFSRVIRKIEVTRAAVGPAVAGQPVKVKLTLRNANRRATAFTVVAVDHAGGPARVKLSAVSAVQLAAGGRQSFTYTCTFPRRGVYRFTHVLLKSRFPFGLFEVQFERPLEQEVVVYPAIGSLKALPDGHADHFGQRAHSHGNFGQDEFANLRDYRPDDNPRRIHWRTSARLQKLHVMEFHGLPTKSAEIEFDTAVCKGSDFEVFEKAARFAATLADRMLSDGYSMSFSLRGKAPLSGPGRKILPEILDTLARVEPIVCECNAPEPANGAKGLKVRITSHGKCSSGDRFFVAAASDPELDRWYSDCNPAAEGRL